MSFDPEKISYVASIDDVRGRHPPAMSRATDKVLTTLDKHCRAILDVRHFVSSARRDRMVATCPRAATRPASFASWTIATCCCPTASATTGSNSMANLFVNPTIGLLFLVPGMSETLRVNGFGRVTDDAGLLAASAVQNRAPKIGILIQVQEAFIHCAKSLNRAGLWVQRVTSTAANCRATATSSPIRLTASPKKKASGRAPRWRGAGCTSVPNPKFALTRSAFGGELRILKEH